MDVFHCIRTRRSVRKYKDVSLEWDKIGQIVKTALEAPSAGNLQNWKYIIIQDDNTRKAVAQACLEQYWMEKAPAHIIVCADPQKARQFYGIRGDRLYSIQNCAAAIQNMLLAANAIGVGACWIGAFDEEMLKRASGIPDYVRPQGVITLGYADEKPPKPAMYRMRDMVFREKWGRQLYDLDWYWKDYAFSVENRIKKNLPKWHKSAEKMKESVSKKSKEIIDNISQKFSDDKK